MLTARQVVSSVVLQMSSIFTLLQLQEKEIQATVYTNHYSTTQSKYQNNRIFINCGGLEPLGAKVMKKTAWRVRGCTLSDHKHFSTIAQVPNTRFHKQCLQPLSNTSFTNCAQSYSLGFTNCAIQTASVPGRSSTCTHTLMIAIRQGCFCTLTNVSARHNRIGQQVINISSTTVLCKLVGTAQNQN